MNTFKTIFVQYLEVSKNIIYAKSFKSNLVLLYLPPDILCIIASNHISALTNRLKDYISVKG